MGHTYRQERSRKGWACWIALGVCLGLGSVAAPVRAQAPAQPADRDAAREKISLDLVDADLRDAISLVFKDSGLNHVIGDGVYGQGVTLRLDNVPRETALNMLLDPKGFMSVKQNGVYLIKPKPLPAGMVPGMGGGYTGGSAGSGMMPNQTGEAGELSTPTGTPFAMASGGGESGGIPGLGGAGAPTAAARSNIPVKIRLKHMSPLELLAGGPIMGGANQMGGMGQGNAGGYGGYGGNQGGYGGGMGGGYGGGMGGGMMGGMGGGMMGGMGGGMMGGMGGMGGGFGGNMGGFGNNNNNNNNNWGGGGGAMMRPTLRR